MIRAANVLAWSAAGLTCAWAASASADDKTEKLLGIYLSPGVAWTWMQQPVVARGLGFELSAAGERLSMIP